MGLSSLSTSFEGGALLLCSYPNLIPLDARGGGAGGGGDADGGCGRMLLFPRVRSSRRGGVRMGMVGAGVGAG